MYFDERRALLEAAAHALSTARLEGKQTETTIASLGAVPSGAALFFSWKRGCLSADWGFGAGNSDEEIGDLRATFQEVATVN